MARKPIVPAVLTHGPFTLAEAEQAGLTRKHLRSAAWRRVGPGIHIWAGLTETPMLRLAAVLNRLPAGAAFSGLTAAWLHGLDVAPCDPIEVTIPPTCGVSALAGLFVRRAELDPTDVIPLRGLPVMTMVRTVADLARHQPVVETVVVADMALHLGRTTEPALAGWLEAHAGRKGSARLRTVLELVEPKTESPMETRLRLVLVLGGLPKPVAQPSLHDTRGRFLGRPDLYYPDHRLIIEFDGGVHRDRDRMVSDNRRQNRLLSEGYRLLRFTGADVLGAPETVLAIVRAALSTPPKTAIRRPMALLTGAEWDIGRRTA